MSQPSADAPRRADALRNRALVLEAARAALAAGQPLQLNAVARRAGVGVGTVYRHFATPEALREGLVEHRFAEVVALAAAAGRIDDGSAALRGFLSEAVRVCVADPTFADVLTGSTAAVPGTVAARAEVVAGVQRLVRRVAGRMRPGLDAVDLLALVHGVALATRLRPGSAPRYLEALVAGIAAPGRV